jgi:SET domain-containing protein
MSPPDAAAGANDRDEARTDTAYVAASPIHGRGLFAARDLRAGEWIGRYEGVRTDEDGTYVLWVEDDVPGGWTGWDGRNALRFLNHARPANAEMDGRDCYAAADIPRDAEITIDYGEWFEPLAPGDAA